MISILYFAWMKERVGLSSEDITLPDGVTTLADLVAHLKARSDGHARAFETPALVRAAVDQTHAGLDTDIRQAREIAFFPPVTGG